MRLYWSGGKIMGTEDSLSIRSGASGSGKLDLKLLYRYEVCRGRFRGHNGSNCNYASLDRGCSLGNG